MRFRRFLAAAAVALLPLWAAPAVAQTTSKIVTDANATGQTGAMQTGPRTAGVTFQFCGTGFTGGLAVDAAATSAALAEVWTTSLSGNSDCTTTYAPVTTKWYRVRWTRTAGVLNVWMTTTSGDSGGGITPPGGGLVAGQVPYATGPSAVAGSSGLTYAAATRTLATDTVSARNLTATALATPTITSPLVVGGTAGAVTRGYKVVAYLADGTSTAASAEVTTATGPTTLSATNTVSGTIAVVPGAVNYRVYRTTGTGPGLEAAPRLISTQTGLSFTDTGAAGTAQTPATSNGTGRVTTDGFTMATGAGALRVLTSDASGNASWAVGGGGITNAAGANVIPKSDGTNLVATSLAEAIAGSFATSAGVALGLTATAPAATTGASQVGKAVTITASPAVASTDTAGAAAGGSVTITAGAAAGNTSGNANGGDIRLYPGDPIGTGKYGKVIVAGSTDTGDYMEPRLALNAAGTVGFSNYQASSLEFFIGGYPVGQFRAHDHTFALNNGAGTAWAFAMGATNITTPGTVFLRPKGSANPAWGLASATPVAYTHGLAADSRAGTDTNIGGGSATIQPGTGTGTGTPSTLTISTPVLGSTGSAAQTLTARAVFGPTGVNIPGLATHADNAAAITGGLVTGDLYRTSTGVLMIVYTP